MIDLNAYNKRITDFPNIFTYTNNSTHIIVTNMKNTTVTDIYIPNKYDNKIVALSNTTFYNKDYVINIYLEDGIVTNNGSGYQMFYDCQKLQRVVGNLPSGITNAY